MEVFKVRGYIQSQTFAMGDQFDRISLIVSMTK
jgi:hypothetical protein